MERKPVKVEREYRTWFEAAAVADFLGMFSGMVSARRP
ncbi:hypothetical protein Ct9H90mP29_16090 [bacterium]|nr:MAG: hypothetical protein Ct9H90mP29_16090 [bacterium]